MTGDPPADETRPSAVNVPPVDEFIDALYHSSIMRPPRKDAQTIERPVSSVRPVPAQPGQGLNFSGIERQGLHSWKPSPVRFF